VGKHVEKVLKHLAQRRVDVAVEWEMLTLVELDEYRMTPIEELFYVEFCYQTFPENKFLSGIHLYISHQVKTPVSKNKAYIIDFVICCKEQNQDEQITPETAVLVELDSYLWHGQTPEQFEKEKKRERDLKKAGYDLLRFSGREIMRDVGKCVREAITYTQKRYNEDEPNQ
jgi:very-short-patch-repair endonuclease|tara:strand:- start:546 stop:1058 length:513 start_codon:yes stop_codon:yes gene_type:complete